MFRKTIIISMLLGFLLPACAQQEGPVDVAEPVIQVVEPTLADLVIDNCYAVQSAAVRFALENNNEYPEDIDEISAGGHTLIDLLPDTTYLDNPFTGAKTEPAYSTAWQPGETAYRPLYNYDQTLGRMFVLGYIITGCGESSRCFTLSNLPPSFYEKDEQTIENCFTVMRAVEAFAAENSGRYPYNISADQTPLGNTVIDLQPGGILLENPYHLCRTEPVDGAAATQGQTGYTVCINGVGQPSGYVITGAGSTYEIIIQICRDPE